MREINLARNVTLACGHPERYSTLNDEEDQAFCPSCDAWVAVEKTEAP